MRGPIPKTKNSGKKNEMSVNNAQQHKCKLSRSNFSNKTIGFVQSNVERPSSCQKWQRDKDLQMDDLQHQHYDKSTVVRRSVEDEEDDDDDDDDDDKDDMKGKQTELLVQKNAQQRVMDKKRQKRARDKTKEKKAVDRRKCIREESKCEQIKYGKRRRKQEVEDRNCHEHEEKRKRKLQEKKRKRRLRQKVEYDESGEKVKSIYNLNRTLKKGNFVRLCETNTPRGQWPLGKIVGTIEGRDGLVRSCVVKTKTSLLHRPITKLCLLESSE